MQRNFSVIQRTGAWRERGFTLVELLVVISIIAVLVALIMPAVNSSREAGRRTQCMNNVKQLALANLAHEAAQQRLPGGGWGWGWVGDPDRGIGIRQPGGWIYNILPYIDQNDLHDMGKGLSAANKLDPQGLRTSTPVLIMICPTRRKVQAFPWSPHGNQTNFTFPTVVGRSDYAANGGDKVIEPGTMNLWNGETIDGVQINNCGNSDCGPATFPPEQVYAAVKATAETYGATGIDYPMSTLSLAAVTDGPAYTYLLGEKNLAPNMYYTGTSQGDNENLYMGFNADIGRWTVSPPAQDRNGNDVYYSNLFGSAHEAGFNMAFCDGSARQMSYAIDPTTHQQLGNRKDGQPTNLDALEKK
jgi:prepilin-type N-terminal cleavage/methylation domain-containing protein/prepilin-type processing-associated H-X9-DG protein